MNEDTAEILTLEEDLDSLFGFTDDPAVPTPSKTYTDTTDGALTVIDHSVTPNAWPPKLLMDLALGIDDLKTILLRYEMSIGEYNAISNNRIFNKELVAITKELQENGITFKKKAALQAEMYLVEMDSLMSNKLTPPSVKTDIFKTLAKFGDLEPEKKTDASASGPAFNIQINL